MTLRRAIFALICIALPSLVHAEEEPKLSMELNATDTVENACRLTFVLQNALDQDIDALRAETVLFSSDGQVVLLTIFDFGILPVNRPRVRQFQVPGRDCDSLGQVLVNGLDTCTIGGAASDMCQSSLTLSSRVRIELEG